MRRDRSYPVHVHVAGWEMAHVAEPHDPDSASYLVSARCRVCHQVVVGVDADGAGVEAGTWRTMVDLLDDRRIAVECELAR